MSIVRKKAPEFFARAIVNGEELEESFSLSQFLGKKYVVLFFYPKDFTFVCPTELFAFQEKLTEFESLNTAVVGCSCDTDEVHLAWLSTPKNRGGIEGIKYPLVADISKTIAANYGVLGGEYGYNENEEMVYEGLPFSLRATFIIDKEGVVRSSMINDLPLGRNIDDTLRLVKALQHTEKHGDVCPANWEEGKDTLKETRDSVANYLATH
jgi:peroxiredoxin (alkyl hydroperoxide reductase subunit C)